MSHITDEYENADLVEKLIVAITEVERLRSNDVFDERNTETTAAEVAEIRDKITVAVQRIDGLKRLVLEKMRTASSRIEV